MLSKQGMRWIGLVVLFIGIPVVLAHANLQQSFPSANSTIPLSPSEIRLWFTEPIEPAFSRIIVFDTNGTTVNTPASVVENDNPTQLVMRSPNLSNGLYTVDWRVVSATDGHATHGSFAFIIGVGSSLVATTPQILESTTEVIPIVSSAVRWFNLVSLSIIVGAIGFYGFVWRPLITVVPTPDHGLGRMRVLMWIGWGAVGVAGVLILMLQVSLVTDTPFLEAWRNVSLVEVITNTRFGDLWRLRMGIWLVMGVLVWLARRDYRVYGFAFMAACLLLVTVSLFSHAAGLTDGGIGIFADWLHLIATTLWIGGLITFVVLLPMVKAQTTIVSQWVGYFSNMARLCVLILIITGLYATYVQVGSVHVLLSTTYGHALLIKWLLFAPVMWIAAVNLLVTSRRLRRGTAVWVGYLRNLVGLEIVLTVGVLVTVGALTAITPANTEHALYHAQVTTNTPQPYSEMQESDAVMVHLEVTPFQIGENTFIVSLYDKEGNSITDATLIRMRFENKTASIGKSELRPTLQPDGTYLVVGTNLSVIGDWKVRVSVQRPQQFDAIVDFAVKLQAPSKP